MRKLIIFVSDISDYTTLLVNKIKKLNINISFFYGPSSSYYCDLCNIKNSLHDKNSLMNLLRDKEIIKNLIGLNGGIDWKINESIIEKIPILNLHPSPLPLNRGSHHSFWSIINDEPHGATLHWMDKGLDTGPIICKKVFNNDGKSTADKIQKRSEALCLELLEEFIYKILTTKRLPTGDKQTNGSFHFKKEIDEITTLNYDDTITVEHLFKLCRGTCAKNNGFKISKDGKDFAKVIIKDII